MRFTTILKAAAVPGVLAAALLGTSAAAFAATGPGSNGQAGQLTGNKATAYVDPYFGPVQCNETQHPAFDTVSCKAVVNVNPDGSVVKGSAVLWRAAGESSQIGWNSDFGNNALQPQPGQPQFASHVNPGTLTYTVNPDGTGYTGQVVYNG